jgi:hypothetical protein
MSLVWSSIYAALFLAWGRRVATVMGIASFSHFVLDLPMHPHDLALWPGSETHLGFGLWELLPQGWWFVELAFIVLGGAYYVRASRSSESFGRRSVTVVIVVVLLHVFNSPWLSAI